MRIKITLILLVLMTTAACSAKTETPTAIVQVIGPGDVSQANSYSPVDCKFQGRGGPGPLNVKCGTFSVPVDWSKPDGDKINLSVATFKSSSTNPKSDPVLLLLYGPSGEVNLAPFFAYTYTQMVQDRDIIAIDQRGVGGSDPSFTCPELSSAFTNTISLRPYSDETIALLLKAEQGCYQKWIGQGVDFTLYSSDSTAKDIEGLRQALGYQQWNIYASGYGSQIALQLMRDYGQTVRSVVLDSVGPLSEQDFMQQAPNTERVINLFFQDCASDAGCGKAFPDLKTTFYALVDQLNASPQTLPVADLNTGNHYQLLLDGNRLIDLLLSSISGGSGRSSMLEEMPRMIYQMKNGQFGELAKLLGSSGTQFAAPSSVGMQWVVNCVEVAPLLTTDQLMKGAGQVDNHLREYYNQRISMNDQTCAIWKDVQAQGKPSWPEVPASSIPTMILYGDHNPWVSPEWSKRVGALLSDAAVVEIVSKSGSGGFDRSTSDCQRSLISSFLTDPGAQPDTSCAAQNTKIEWITLQ